MASGGSLPIIPSVDIDDKGNYKYILIEIQHKTETEPRQIVRGYNWGEYHADIFGKVNDELRLAGYECSCKGGGWIEHAPEKKTIRVYGYSVSYGPADHQKTVSLLQDRYSDYSSISFSDEG